MSLFREAARETPPKAKPAEAAGLQSRRTGRSSSLAGRASPTEPIFARAFLATGKVRPVHAAPGGLFPQPKGDSCALNFRRSTRLPPDPRSLAGMAQQRRRRGAIRG